MKKPTTFDVISTVVFCGDCGKGIKQNIVDRKKITQTGRIRGLRCNPCYHIYEAGRGHRMGKFGNPRVKFRK